MDGLQQVSSNESFSYSWVVNLRRSVHGGEGGEHQLGPALSCRASLDASGEGSNNYIEIDLRSPPWMNIISNLKRSSSRVDVDTDMQAEFNFNTSTAAAPPPNNNNNNSDLLQTHHHRPPPDHHDLVHPADQIFSSNGLININNFGLLQPAAGYSFNRPVFAAAQPPHPQPVLLLHETADSGPRSVQKGRPPEDEFPAPPVPPPPPHDHHHLQYHYLSRPAVAGSRDEYFSSVPPRTSSTHNCSLLRRWRRCSQMILSKYLGFLRPPCRTPLGIRRMTTTTTAIIASTTSSPDEGPAPGASVDHVVLVDDRHPAASSSSSSSPSPSLACVVHHYSSCIACTSSTTTPRTTTTTTTTRSTTATAATVPHLSLHHHHNLLFDVDLETSIYDAVLHCKKSIADLKIKEHI